MAESLSKFEEEDIKSIIRYLQKFPNGKELFDKYYVQEGFASNYNWEEFIKRKKKKNN